MLLTSKPILIILRIGAAVSARGSRPASKRVLWPAADGPRLAVASIGWYQLNPASGGAEPNLEDDGRGLSAPLAESELKRAGRERARNRCHWLIWELSLSVRVLMEEGLKEWEWGLWWDMFFFSVAGLVYNREEKGKFLNEHSFSLWAHFIKLQ